MNYESVYPWCSENCWSDPQQRPAQTKIGRQRKQHWLLQSGRLSLWTISYPTRTSLQWRIRSGIKTFPITKEPKTILQGVVLLMSSVWCVNRKLWFVRVNECWIHRVCEGEW